jgi:hypothetical protein
MQCQVPSVWTRQCRLRWRWWATPKSLLSFDLSRRARGGSVITVDPEPLHGSSSWSAMSSSLMTAASAGAAVASASAAGAGVPTGGGPAASSALGSRPLKRRHTDAEWGGSAGFAPPAPSPSSKRLTLGRFETVATPIPRGFAEAKATYIRRAKVDRDVRLIFRMVLKPQLQVRACEYLVSIGVEARDCLQRLSKVDMTHAYLVDSVLREINEVAMVQHVRGCRFRS